MSWEAWLTIGIVAAMTVGLAMNVAAADALLLLTAIVLASLRLISDQFLEPDQVAAAFGNEGLVTVGALFVVARASRTPAARAAWARRCSGGPTPTRPRRCA